KEVLADLEVSFLQTGDLSCKAFNRPFLSTSAEELIYISEVAGARHWHTKRIADRLAAAQFRIGKAGLRILNRFVVVLRLRPCHLGFLLQTGLLPPHDGIAFARYRSML